MQIIVFFVTEEKLGAQKMLEYIGRMKEDQIYRAVLILQKKLSGPANSERMLVKNSYRIEDVRAFPFARPLIVKLLFRKPCGNCVVQCGWWK